MQGNNFVIIYRDIDGDMEYFVYVNKAMTADEQERGMIELVKRFDDLTMEQADLISEQVSEYTGTKEMLLREISTILK